MSISVLQNDNENNLNTGKGYNGLSTIENYSELTDQLKNKIIEVLNDNFSYHEGDIDVLLKSKKKSTYKKFIEKLTEMKYLYNEHLALGPKKYNGLARIDGCLLYRRIDIMYTTPEEYPFAILYFTGSMEFNAKMRGIVLERGLSTVSYTHLTLPTS